MFDFDEVVQQEFDKLVAEITEVYEQSGKKVSGEFTKGLKVSQSTNGWILEGFGYLAGRLAGKPPPVNVILEWVKAKGLQPIAKGQTQTQLAYAIAYNIGKKGTDSKYHLKIYEQVITPQRIQEILDKVVKFNVIAFVDAVTIELRLLTKGL